VVVLHSTAADCCDTHPLRHEVRYNTACKQLIITVVILFQFIVVQPQYTDSVS